MGFWKPKACNREMRKEMAAEAEERGKSNTTARITQAGVLLSAGLGEGKTATKYKLQGQGNCAGPQHP